MRPGAEQSDEIWLSPDDAFSVLGNDIRINILQMLGEADGPLTFTELRNELGIRQGGQFNYHLDKVVGYFVEKTADGYRLREPGRRVVEAVLSGAVTTDPVLEPTEIEFGCHHCGSPVEIDYSHGTMRMSCTKCAGQFDESNAPRDLHHVQRGTLANYRLPPAGVVDRTPEEVMRTAATWGHLDSNALACGVCPRCSAIVDQTVQICDEHDAGNGRCERCHSRFAVLIESRCSNCIFEARSSAVILVLAVPEMLVFVGEHGLNMTSRGIEWGWDFDEEILSTDPFKARFTFTIDGDAISLTIDEYLDIVAVER